MNENVFLTFDIDWASDEVILSVAEQLVEAKIKSTWFVTHETPILEFFRSRKNLFNLGIHPNFLKGTTQGDSEEEILKNLMTIVPEAKVIRTHAVFQYGKLLSEIVNLTPIRIDSSIFLPEMKNIQTVEHLTPYGTLKRIPILWADDYELLKENSDWQASKYFLHPGHKLFLFHPIHIFLNTVNMNQYSEYKYDKKIMINNENKGTNVFFSRLLKYINENKISTKFLTE